MRLETEMEKDQIRGSVHVSGGRLTDIATDEQEFKLQFIAQCSNACG